MVNPAELETEFNFKLLRFFIGKTEVS